jgi:hypothetical protein
MNMREVRNREYKLLRSKLKKKKISKTQFKQLVKAMREAVARIDSQGGFGK